MRKGNEACDCSSYVYLCVQDTVNPTPIVDDQRDTTGVTQPNNPQMPYPDVDIPEPSLQPQTPQPAIEPVDPTLEEPSLQDQAVGNGFDDGELFHGWEDRVSKRRSARIPKPTEKYKRYKATLNGNNKK